jgi:hypothetical protein
VAVRWALLVVLTACASGPPMRVVSRASIDSAAPSAEVELAEAGREYFLVYRATVPLDASPGYRLSCPGAGMEGDLAPPASSDEMEGGAGISGAEARSMSTHMRNALDEPPPRPTGKRTHAADETREVEGRLRVQLDAAGRCSFELVAAKGDTLDGVSVELRLETGKTSP